MAEESRADRALSLSLRPFAKVEPSEAVTACVMIVTVFLLLSAYYLLERAREPLILLHGGAEVKSYAAAGQAVLLLGFVQAYGWVANEVGRMRLLLGVYLFLASNLVIFAALARSAVRVAIRTLLAAVPPGSNERAAQIFLGTFKADYFEWVNILGVVLQLFAVSRILERLGVREALFFLPVVAFGGYTVMLVSPVLPLIRLAKVAENSLDYSVQNTARQALYLLATRVEKYVGKDNAPAVIHPELSPAAT